MLVAHQEQSAFPRNEDGESHQHESKYAHVFNQVCSIVEIGMDEID